MKRIRAGRNSSFTWAIACFILLFIFFVAPFVVKTNKSSFMNVLLVTLLNIWVDVVIIKEVLTDKELFVSVKINQDEIQLWRLRRLLKSYDISKVAFSYKIWLNQKTIYPALMISDRKDAKQEKAYIEHLGYDKSKDYFLIILTEKRWEILSQILYDKIELPSYFNISELDFIGRTKAEKFYKIIMDHNNEKTKNL